MEDPGSTLILAAISWNEILIPTIICLIILILLLCLSAMVSGAEVAFFSLSPSEREEIEEKQSKSAQIALKLLEKPKDLLAVILIANNFVNVGIIILSSYLSNLIFPPGEIGVYTKFVIDVVVITFVLLLFGEVIPKIYATKNGERVSLLMSLPLYYISRIFPFNVLKNVLVGGTSRLSRFLTSKKSVSVSSDELEQALELTREEDTDHKILEGIVKFGNKDVKQIMKSRLDVIAFDSTLPYDELFRNLRKSSYSRMPIFNESFDNIQGVLHVKDLLPHIDEKPTFHWQKLIREPYFVPENKKIDDLLKNFQEMKMHMAIVVDEYGGKSGIVTLEDVLEEIVGDISDEFDREDLVYSKLDDNNFVFEGKTPLIDMYRVMEINGDVFEEAKSDSDTIAGFVIEQAGKILKKNERVTFENFTFTIEAADNRKVKRIKITRNTENGADENE